MRIRGTWMSEKYPQNGCSVGGGCAKEAVILSLKCTIICREKSETSSQDGEYLFVMVDHRWSTYVKKKKGDIRESEATKRGGVAAFVV
jgi:hypothetical protein